MFIRGTQNVYPGLYEPLIAGLPGVEEVAMVGVPDAIGDDRIVVAIVPTSTAVGTGLRNIRSRAPCAGRCRD